MQNEATYALPAVAGMTAGMTCRKINDTGTFDTETGTLLMLLKIVMVARQTNAMANKDESSI